MVIEAFVPANARRGEQLVAVRLVVNPATDDEFRERAELLAQAVTTPEQLQDLLRADYRHARVVRGVTDVYERWYVYREGRWVNSQGRPI